MIDKSTWGDGPWQDEPDRLAWEDEVTGYYCLALRSETMGHLCGYVGLPPGHPAWGQDYDDLDVEVHGDPTYAQGSDNASIALGTGHWVVGFDCAHLGDLLPGTRSLLGRFVAQDTYRTLDFVMGECQRLAQQLKELGAAEK